MSEHEGLSLVAFLPNNGGEQSLPLLFLKRIIFIAILSHSIAWTRNQELENMDEEIHQDHILKERSKNQDIKRFLEMLKK